MRCKFMVVLFCASLLAEAPAQDELQKPVPVSTRKIDGTRITGRIVSHDDSGFEVVNAKEESETVHWDELAPKDVFSVGQKLITGKDADAYVRLGGILLRMEHGKELAEKAFKIAVKFDPESKNEIEKIKEQVAEDAADSDKPDAAEDEGEGEEKEGKGEDGPPGGEKPDEGLASGPNLVGDIDKEAWGTQTPEQEAERVTKLKKFAGDAMKKMGRPLRLYETKYFLFYSDLSAQEAKNWAGLLDRMYARLAVLFAVEKGKNLWHGKALVIVFSRESDYERYQMKVNDTDPAGSAGMCHCYGNGDVHIAFFRQPEEREFAHVLVHEAVHGFIHRYRSPEHIPSWINEGLAEVIARELVPGSEKLSSRQTFARYSVSYRGGMNGLLDTRRITPWQYSVSEVLTTFMIQQNKKNYVAFFNGIKDGMDWEESLEKNYKTTRDRLVPAFLKWLNVPERDWQTE